jgi:methyl-accepting chemotaxis protein
MTNAIRISLPLFVISAILNLVLAGITSLITWPDVTATVFSLTFAATLMTAWVYHLRVIQPLAAAEKALLAGEDSTRYAGGLLAPLMKASRTVAETQFRSVAISISDGIEKNSISLAATSHKLDQLDKNAQLISGKSREISDAAETIAATTAQVSASASSAASFATQTRNDSIAGRASLQQAINDMRQMSSRTQETSSHVAKLTESSGRIQEITQVIEGIAGQINLLALNAAIEAARAGEQGRGFAVVADEVRKLAERTSTATGQIGTMVTEIHAETAEAVATMSSLAEEVEQGVCKVEKVGAQLDGILQYSSALEEQVRSIAEGAENNHNQVGQISGALTQMREELGNIETEMKEVSDQAMALSDLSEGLHESLAELNLDTIHGRMCQAAREAADQIERVFEQTIQAGQIKREDLFDRNYRPVANTNPQKFTTRFDEFTDRVLPDIQERTLQQHPEIIYAAATDTSGYIPTHNKKFSKPLTGNYDTDLASNRTKRLFNDRTGSRCGNHTKKLLLQTYKRDTGEIMHDISVPIFIAGKHWGGFRMGYKAA